MISGLHSIPVHDDTISMTSITSAASYHPSYPVTQDIRTHKKEETMQGMGSLSSLPSYNEVVIHDFRTLI